MKIGWNKQINSEGDNLADWAAKNLDRIANALEEIIDLLKPKIIYKLLSREEIEEMKKQVMNRFPSEDETLHGFEQKAKEEVT